MSSDIEESRFERGMKKRAEMNGLPTTDSGNKLGDLGTLIVEFAYGDLYTRTVLTDREREIAAIAVLTSLGGREPQLRAHLKTGVRLGMTREELEEVILQTVAFAGFPSAINAHGVLKAVFEAQSD